MGTLESITHAADPYCYCYQSHTAASHTVFTHGLDHVMHLYAQ